MSQHDAENGTSPSSGDAGDAARSEHTESAVDTESVDESAEATGDSELEAAREEAAQLKDQYVRLQAEMENVRKRAEKDVESARKYGVEKFAKELLGVRDSLEAGLASASESDTDPGKIREGMELTDRMLGQAMEKFGVEPMNPEGEVFDPEYHEAMSMQPSAEHAPNTVMTVVQKGYVLNGRVIRPAMVVVSSAPADDSTRQE